VRRYHPDMRRIAVFLTLLLLVLTFNAYACLLPLPTSSGMDCSSSSHEPVRKTCDAFIEIGPHSEFSSNPSVTALLFDLDVPAQITPVVFFVSQPDRSPRSRDAPIHPSIQSTVLRI
jgi:hypothetical protein